MMEAAGWLDCGNIVMSYSNETVTVWTVTTSWIELFIDLKDVQMLVQISEVS